MRINFRQAAFIKCSPPGIECRERLGQVCIRNALSRSLPAELSRVRRAGGCGNAAVPPGAAPQERWAPGDIQRWHWESHPGSLVLRTGSAAQNPESSRGIQDSLRYCHETGRVR